MADNKQRPIIQSSGYNGSEPTRICPHCGKEKPLSDFGYRKMKKGEKIGGVCRIVSSSTLM